MVENVEGTQAAQTTDHRCIGIIGGMSAESTATCYLHIHHLHFTATGRHDYPRIVIGSIPFERVSEASHEGDWDAIGQMVQAEGEALERAGADFLIIATNTIHKVMPGLRFGIPLLALYDAVAVAAAERGIATLGLTGTRFTMSGGFYEQALTGRGLRVVIPAEDDQETIHRIIYEELTAGVIEPASQAAFREAGRRLLERGAEAVLLGCTELEMLVREGADDLPVLDTTATHAEAAWRYATRRADYPLFSGGQIVPAAGEAERV